MQKKSVDLQVLRFFAALMVVISHVGFYISERTGTEHNYWRAGVRGVDIFFVISGYVMAASFYSIKYKNDSWKKFISDRFSRILPLYWLITTLKLALTFLLPGASLHNKINIINFLKSLFFIPYKNLEMHYEPIVGVGWTLNFEMFFYFIVAMLIAFNFDISIYCFIIFSLISIVGELNFETGLFIDFYFNSIIMEFFFGIIIFRYVKNINKIIACAFVFFGFLALISSKENFAFINSNIPRFILNGLPAALIVAGILFLGLDENNCVVKFLSRLGNESYSLYLIHPIIAPAIVIFFAKFGLKSAPIFYFSCILVCIYFSRITYNLIEQPTSKFMKNFFASKFKTKSG